MKPVEFPEQNVVYAKDQPEYLPLPARRFDGQEGHIAFCWKLTWHERLKVLFTGVIWHSVWTFNQPLQPQLLQVDRPFLVAKASLLRRVMLHVERFFVRFKGAK